LNKVAILWNLTSGPTPDFILGQIYSSQAEGVYTVFRINKIKSEFWAGEKRNMYREKNCAFLGK